MFNVSYGMGSDLSYEADIVKLNRTNYAIETEIKVSKQDIKKDKTKKHCHDSKLFKYLYFAVPDYLEEFALEYIPDKAGLLVVSQPLIHYKINEVRTPTVNPRHVKWSSDQRQRLTRLGCLRILSLKEKILKHKLR